MTLNDYYKAGPPKVAVFYDFCNIIRKTEGEVLSLAQEILDEARSFGEVVKAFAFTNTHTPPTTETALNLKGFYVIVCPPIKQPKDTGDEKLRDFVNLILELGYIVDVFIVVSGDGDFVALKSLVENRKRQFVVFHDGTINDAFRINGCQMVNLRERRSQRLLIYPDENNKDPKGNELEENSVPDLQTEHPPPEPENFNGYLSNTTYQKGRGASQSKPVSLLPKPSLIDNNPYYEILYRLKNGLRADTQTAEWRFLKELVRMFMYYDLTPNDLESRKSFRDLVNELQNRREVQSCSRANLIQDLVDSLSALTREEFRIIEAKTPRHSTQKYYVFNNQSPLLRRFAIKLL